MKMLVFDLDGVIITYKKNFAETYSAEFGVELGKIYEFFTNDYRDCAVGRSNLRSTIKEYVSLWAWPGDVDSLIQYWFKCQSTVDTRLLKLIESARRSGHMCYVASDQDNIRSEYVRTLVDFESEFDGHFFSCDVGATKTENEFFEHVILKLGCPPANVHFWDDNPKNVATAQQSGLQAEVYTSYDNFQPAFRSRFVSTT